jgi:RNA 3'-terminal phosphate cyclase (ATP)
MAGCKGIVMIEIDGSEGEGGGQILRTSLSLSVVTGKPFAIRNIRARRSKPGLMRQHLMAVKAAAEISGARVEGAEVGSPALVFRPGSAKAGDYVFRIGSAGSTGLVLQTVLLPLALTGGRSSVLIEGGTHNVHAPPYEFLERVFLPMVRRIGFNVALTLKRPGFYPAGGGAIAVEIGPAEPPRPLIVEERGPALSRMAEAMIANLPSTIAERELATIGSLLGWAPEELFVRMRTDVTGPGNCLMLTMRYEQACEVVTAFGRIGASSEAVAAEAAQEARAYLACGAPVGEHLADQLLLPMALAAGGRFVTGTPSLHLLTNADVIGLFLDVAISIVEVEDGLRSVTVSGGQS